MRSTAITLVVGALLFGCGWFVSDLMRTDAPPLGEMRTESTQQKRVDVLAAQLGRIEELLHHAPQTLADSRTTREPAGQSRDIGALVDRIDALESRVAEVLGKLAEASVSLEELSLSRPSPNKVGIDRLFDAVAKDTSLMQRLTVGMTYRDATLAFGTPTVKRDPPGLHRQSSGLPVTEWLWEVPESGRVLLVQFAGGTAVWTVFTSRASLDDK